ncbi:unnamed protein product (macronuclear) [Paramecium tetraurelia]|uniref:PAS domain-containing protein n=1 Tax=Paramecium tetraurelia TaxID=5888 RepID=A0DV16_PARTE|nr:uncharacterized protein GSPATT00020545001 [Paramecium tetraurelia]CAK86883.1 unnamed protein product [Paramecium tetraurelia]|eukprot:XP_001454280.1 hypothetical protein (macronuclear) [Paramecium tetraurelia strain d4-2]
MSYLQEISFLFENYYITDNGSFSFMKCLILVAEFTRPYKILDENFYRYSYFIPLAINLIYYSLVLKLFINHKYGKSKYQKLLETFYQQNRFFIILMTILTFIQAFHFHLVFANLIELSVASISHNSQLNDVNVGNLIFAIITLIIVILNMIAQMICNLEFNQITQQNFGVLQQSFSLYWQQMSILLVILINQLNADHTIKFYLIFTLLALKLIFCVQSQLLYFISLFYKTYVELIGLTAQLTILIILLILQIQENDFDRKDSLLFIVSYPLLIHIVLNSFQEFHEKILLNRKNTLNAYQQQYKIAEIFLKFGVVYNSHIENKQNMAFIYNFQLIHKESCQSNLCYCQTSNLNFEQIITIFLKEQIQLFGEVINEIKDKTIRQSMFLRYLSFISYLGFSTKAFQQSNVQVIHESEINSKSNIYNNQRSESNKVESSHSLDQKSHSQQRQRNELEHDEFTRVKIMNLSFINQIKLRMLQDSIKKSMSNGLRKQSIMQENLEHAVNLFLMSETANKRLKEKIITSLNRKRQYFNNILLNTGSGSIFSNSKNLLIKFKKIENELLKLYDQFPSRKMQALNTFLQAELMNNYFSAYKLTTVASISDEKLLKMQSQISIDLFSSKLDYIIFGFDKKSHYLQMQSTSNLIHQFFGYTQEQFKQMNFIEAILPQGFDLIHQKLIQNFLQSGESKFYKQINLSFCRTTHKCIKPIDFFFDINLSNFEDLTFVTFLQDTQVSPAYILCCENYKIQCMTKNIGQRLGYEQQYHQNLIDLLFKQQINKVFPRFHNIYESFLSKTSILQKDVQDQNNFDDKQTNYDQSDAQIQMIVPNPNIFEKKQNINWDQNEHTSQLTADVVFHLRNVKQELFSYLIVEIRDVKKYLQTEFSTPFQTEIPIKYLAQLTDMDNNFEIIEDQESFCLNPPKALELLENYEKEVNHFGQRLRISQNINNSNSQHIYPNISIALASPKDSASRLIEEKQDVSLQQMNNTISKKKDKNRQQYFSALDQREDQESSNFINSIIQNKQADQNQDQQLDQIDKDLQENIKQQMQIQNFVNDPSLNQINGDGSETSSLAGIKKSRFSKRYDLIQKLTNSQKFSHNFLNMKYMLTLMFLNFLVFGSIEMFYANSDLPQFLKEIDLLQIKANIVGPIDNYIVGQNAVTNYAALFQRNYLTKELAFQEAIYANNEINYTFYELKTSFENQLQNPYLDPFFEDRYVIIQMADYPKTIEYNIRLREAIQLELEASLNFIKTDFLFNDKIDYTQGFFTYLYKNFIPLRELCQQLNEEMLDYSTNRATQVSKNWYQLLIPIVIIGGVLLIVCILFYKYYLQQYDEFLELFSYLDTVWLQRDVDRYRGYASLLMKDSDVLFKYQFDLDAKEVFLINEETKKDRIAQNQAFQRDKSNQQGVVVLQQKMQQLPSIFSFATIYGICFVFCFISNSLAQNFYTKYPESTRFFNLLSDLSMASSGVFSMREISYTIQAEETQIYFFSDKNATDFINLFMTHIKIIDTFLQVFQNFDSSQYITSDQFVTDFYNLMVKDICIFLPDYKQETAQQHCDSSLDGVMRRGMIETLNKVRNNVMNEYESTNQFKIEVIDLQSDLEIGLIAYDDLNSLRDQFQQQLTDTTNQLISQLFFINISFIVILLTSILALLTLVEKYFRWEFNIVKNFVILLPQTSLFLDVQLDRNLRQMVVQDDLI